MAEVKRGRMYYVYFAKSLRNKKVYVGSTSKDPKERVKEHNSGSTKWTSQNKPLKLIYYEKFHCNIDARLKDSFYKSGIGKRIKKLIVEEFS
jgi:putative endonuclease